MSGHVPRIAIPARLSADDVSDGRVAAANLIFHDVVALVRSNGLDPVVVTDLADFDDFDGVVLPGGGDIDPALYGGEPCDAVYDVNPDQDALDLALAQAAIAADKPILGICRGAQVLNVAAGGSLHPDLAPGTVAHSHVPAPGEQLKFVWHSVSLTESRLRDELGADRIEVATGHHQGIAILGSCLRVTAVADDGLIEAFESEDGTVVGVQWHPEAAGTPKAEQDAPFRVLAALIASRESARV